MVSTYVKQTYLFHSFWPVCFVTFTITLSFVVRVSPLIPLSSTSVIHSSHSSLHVTKNVCSPLTEAYNKQLSSLLVCVAL